jgi:hypothetical protein
MIINGFSIVLKKAMHVRFCQDLHRNNILIITEQYAFKKWISTEDATFRLTFRAMKSVNQNMHVGGFLSIWPRLLIVLIMKLC